MKSNKWLGIVVGIGLALGAPGCIIVDDGFCGDGFRDPGEECDDGNNRNGDGCSAGCLIEGSTFCGDGFLDPGEECDDGNNVSGDGCSNCLVDVVEGFCGDGFRDPGEECDDGDNFDGDGCSADCFLESMGYLECTVGGMCGGRDDCIEIDIPAEGTFGAMCTHTCANNGECMPANGFPGRCYAIESSTALCYQQCDSNAVCFSGSTCIDVTLPGGTLDSICVPNNL